MKRKLWRKFQVLNSQYKVYKVKGLVDQGCVGLCNPNKREILIEDSLDSEGFTKTLLHELRHAAQSESALSDILSDQAMEMDAELFAGFVYSLGVRF